MNFAANLHMYLGNTNTFWIFTESALTPLRNSKLPAILFCSMIGDRGEHNWTDLEIQSSNRVPNCYILREVHFVWMLDFVFPVS